jgi:hypothetical protein
MWQFQTASKLLRSGSGVLRLLVLRNLTQTTHKPEKQSHVRLTLLQMSRIMVHRSAGSFTGGMRCRTALPFLPTRQTCMPDRGSDKAEPLSQLVRTRSV